MVALIERLRNKVEAQAREIAVRDARLEKVNFELARLKRWKFGAKTEAMDAQQRALFQDTLFEDEASLQAQLAALQADIPQGDAKAPKAPPRRPRRQACPRTCVVWNIVMIPPTPPVSQRVAANRCNALARTSVRSWILFRPNSLCIVTFMASGFASAARRCARSLPSRMSLKAALLPADWWHTR
ncbi:MAG: transposase [Burkholderiales bacterium]|nr:transposase [Burkholderiales bacterium]